MRTTLTLDDDVAALLARVRKEQNLGLKEAVNEALRHGLREVGRPTAPRGEFRTPTASLGPSLIGSLDNIAEVLAIAEGEDYR